MLPAHVFLYVGRQIVTGNTYGIVADNAAQRNHCNLGRPAAYVYNHIPFGGFDVNSNADGSGHWLKNEVNIASIGVLCRVADGAKLYFCRARGDANDHAQRVREEMTTRVYHLNQPAHHLLAGREVGNNTVAQRSDGAYIVMRLLIHHLGLLANGNHLAGVTVEGYNRRLVNNYLVIADDNSVGGSQVHCYFLNE